MKLNPFVELYVFLSFYSTFDRYLWKLEFEHGDLFVVQLDHYEQRAKISEKKYNRSDFVYIVLDGNKIGSIGLYWKIFKISQT
jgi:UDP-2,3-diacylglucosamine pyrophosphatase LpxH